MKTILNPNKLSVLEVRILNDLKRTSSRPIGNLCLNVDATEDTVCFCLARLVKYGLAITCDGDAEITHDGRSVLDGLLGDFYSMATL